MEFKLPNDIEVVCRELGELFSRKNERLYLVGGALRDVILGVGTNDLDFTTSAPPAAIRRLVGPVSEHLYDKSRAKGYGTQGVKLKSGVEVEITPFRRCAIPEAGEPCDSPDVVSGITLDEDLRSRDFTVNAMAMDAGPSGFGSIVDPCGGRADLEAGMLRTPGDPLRTFEDDPLRVLRAARFISQFGFEPAAGLAEAVRHVVAETGWLERVAMERVRLEIEKMLMAAEPSRGFRLMRGWGLMGFWLPELERLMDMEPEAGLSHKNLLEHTMLVLDRAAETGPSSIEFRLAALLHDVGKTDARENSGEGYTFRDHDRIGGAIAEEICRRLKFSNDAVSHVADLVRKHHRLSAYEPEWTDSAVRRALNDLGSRYAEILALSRADITTSFPGKREKRMRMLDHFLGRVGKLELDQVLNPKPPINGREIMELLGTTPGREVGRAIDYLKKKVIDGELEPDDAETARRMVVERQWVGDDS